MLAIWPGARVRLVGHDQEEWIASLRDALVAGEEARSRGPEM